MVNDLVVYRERICGADSPNVLVWTIIIADLQGFIRAEWNWPISCLNNSETQENGLN